MAAQAGVGFSENPSSRHAGTEAARAARAQCGSASPDLVLSFATAKHDPERLVEGIRAVVGEEAQLLGGAAGGVITNDHLGYEGYEVGVAVLSSDTITADLFVEPDLVGREYEAGRRLGEQIQGSDASSLLFLYDSVKKTLRNGGPKLNMATPIIEGLEESLAKWPTVAGAGLASDAQFVYPAYQIIDDQIERQSLFGVALNGDVRMDTLILHGCRPSSPYHTITQVEGNAVLEIDGEPALERIGQIMGGHGKIENQDLPFFLTLGLNKGEKFVPFREENYANRLCFAVDEERKALIMFEPDLQAGDEVQLMRQSINLDYIEERMGGFIEQVEEYDPFFALYIDCMGRAAAYNSLEEEEAAEVQAHIGDIPLLGFYSGVEVARCGSDIQALDLTGVLCMFSEGPAVGNNMGEE